MVTTPYYPYFESRHNSDRAEAYPSASEQRQVAYPVFPDLRGSPQQGEASGTSPQRKRIAVACGRCRKRKIRCSGDRGNGQPCHSCRNAGFVPCMFLRVASQETQLRQEGNFSYSIQASRQYHSRGSTSAASSSQASTLPLECLSHERFTDALTYRPGPSLFGYHGRSFDTAATWAGNMSVEQQGVNYSAYPPACHPVQQAEQTEQAEQAEQTQLSRREQKAPEGSQLSITTYANLVCPGAACHNQAAASAASSSDVHGRVIPISRATTPAGRAAFAAGGGIPYRTQSCSPTHGGSSQSSPSGSCPMTPGSDASSSGYPDYGSSSSFPTALTTQLARPSDLYAPTSPSDAAMFSPGPAAADSLRPSGSGPDMTYRYTDTTTSVTGSPVPTIMSTHMDSRAATDGGHAQHGTSFVAQNHGEHASYMMPGIVGGASDAGAGAGDSDSKVAGPRA